MSTNKESTHERLQRLPRALTKAAHMGAMSSVAEQAAAGVQGNGGAVVVLPDYTLLVGSTIDDCLHQAGILVYEKIKVGRTKAGRPKYFIWIPGWH